MRRSIAVALVLAILMSIFPTGAFADSITEISVVEEASEVSEELSSDLEATEESTKSEVSEEPSSDLESTEESTKSEVSEEPSSDLESTESTNPEISEESKATTSAEPIETPKPMTKVDDSIKNDNGQLDVEAELPSGSDVEVKEVEKILSATSTTASTATMMSEYPVRIIIESGDESTAFYHEGDLVTVSTPSKEHYQFTGWEVESESSFEVINNRFVMPANPVTLQAQWKPEVYSVTVYFMTESGRILSSALFSDVTYGYTYEFQGELPVISGYTVSKITRNDDTEWTDIPNFKDFLNVEISKNEEFVVWYKPYSVDYTVNHYLQDLDGGYSKVYESETKLDEFGSTVEVSPFVNIYTGFTWRGIAEGENDSITLGVDNNVINLYYTRNSYVLYYQKTDTTDSMRYLYEQTFNVSDLGTPTRVGYTFDGWMTSSGTDVCGVDTGGVTFKMPANDVTFVAKWKESTANYTVYYWVESLESAQEWTNNHHHDGVYEEPIGWTFQRTISGREGTVGSVITMDMVNNDSAVAEAEIDTYGYSYCKMDQNVTIAADGTSVVNVYYKANIFSYHFHNKAGGNYSFTSDGKNHPEGMLYNKYATSNMAFWPFKNGSKIIVWHKDSPSGSIFTATTSFSYPQHKNTGTLQMYYGESSMSSTVYAIKQNVDGTYPSKNESYVYVSFNGFSSCDINLAASRLPVGFRYDQLETTSGWQTFNAGENIVSKGGKIYGDGKANYVYIRLARREYTLSFSDGNKVVSSISNIKFEANLSNKDVPAISAPEAFLGYDFVGLKAGYDGRIYSGKTPSEAYASFCNTVGDKMPANDVVLTAIWQAPVYTVRFFEDSTFSKLIASETVAKGKTVTNHPANPIRTKYTFDGWFYLEEGVEKLYFEGKVIQSNIDIYAKWTALDVIMADITVRHNYLDDSSLTHTETIQGAVGSVVTIDAEEMHDGYFPDYTSLNCNVADGENVVVFNYKKLGEVAYTVRYIDANGVDIIDAKLATSSNMYVTERYRYIYGCTPRVIAQTIKLSANPDNNVIIFVYDTTAGKGGYTINHYVEKLDGSYERYGDTIIVTDAQLYTKIEATPLVIEGYSFDPSVSNTSDWLTPNKSVVLNLYYTLNSYTVTYRYTNGTTIPAGAPELPTVATYKYGSTVSVCTVTNVKGYNFYGWTVVEGSVVISDDVFSMPTSDIVFEGYFEQMDYCIEVEWEYENGNFYAGEFYWDCDVLDYVSKTNGTWEAAPYVRCKVTNYGAKDVNLNFSASVNEWAKYLVFNPFDNIGTIQLAGNNTSYVFEFSSFDWNYDLLNCEALKVALGDVPTVESNMFKLDITATM